VIVLVFMSIIMTMFRSMQYYNIVTTIKTTMINHNQNNHSQDPCRRADHALTNHNSGLLDLLPGFVVGRALEFCFTDFSELAAATLGSFKPKVVAAQRLFHLPFHLAILQHPFLVFSFSRFACRLPSRFVASCLFLPCPVLALAYACFDSLLRAVVQAVQAS